MVSCMDSGIGNITNALQEYGYLKPDGNTIIIFSADNGGPTTTGDGIGSSNYPLRGGKHSIWEGGTRVTAWIWATPDIIPRTNNPVIGGNYTQLMHLVDWMPTILEAANISHTFPDSLALDGVSHWKGLQNGNNVKDKYFEFRDNVYYGIKYLIVLAVIQTHGYQKMIIVKVMKNIRMKEMNYGKSVCLMKSILLF